MAFLASKWRRDRVSSPKNGVSRLKMVTRTGLVAKNEHFSPKIGDENKFHQFICSSKCETKIEQNKQAVQKKNPLLNSLSF
jgi:hypothetical protein